jgi:hypothetical protein
MGVIAVTSVANHERILCGQEWLQTKRPAEKVLIIGATLGAANEIAPANLTPRKCLGFKTPLQAILKELGKDVQIRFA